MMMTKKLANTAFFYAILSMIGGVFYREFTKLNNFTGVTRLSFVHLPESRIRLSSNAAAETGKTGLRT